MNNTLLRSSHDSLGIYLYYKACCQNTFEMTIWPMLIHLNPKNNTVYIRYTYALPIKAVLSFALYYTCCSSTVRNYHPKLSAFKIYTDFPPLLHYSLAGGKASSPALFVSVFRSISRCLNWLYQFSNFYVFQL